MTNSEPDYENPSVVRINSIALGLVLCFFITLAVVWLFGRGAQALVEPTPDAPPTPDVDPTIVISTPSVLDIRLAMPQADVDRGEVLYQNYGCANCHSLDGSINANGPPLDDIERRIPENEKFPQFYLADVILDPPNKSDEPQGGYTTQMPTNYDELLSAQDVADIVWFLLRQ